MGRSFLVWVAGSLALAWLASWVPVFLFGVRVYGQDASLSFAYLLFGVGLVWGLIASVALFVVSCTSKGGGVVDAGAS